jgi:hypothetical protein
MGVLIDAKCPGLRLVATPGAGPTGAPLRAGVHGAADAGDYFQLHAAGLAKGQEQKQMLRQDVLPKWGARPARR